MAEAPRPVLAQRLLREPLLHFLLAGLAIFAVVAALSPRDTSTEQIEITREDLLVYMQGRAQVFEADTFAALLDAMPAAEREQLVRDAALQEALYREGQALNLAAADPVVRQRIIQQMRTLVIEQAAAGLSVSEEEAAAFFDENHGRYARPSTISFTHVFVRGEDGEARARALLARLQSGEQGVVGDRFAYQRSYAEATPDVIASQFGEGFARDVFSLAPNEWSAPIRSLDGWHLVMPSAIGRGEQAEFASVEAQVREDALAAKRQQLTDRALDDFLNRYEVPVAPGLLP